MANLGKLIGAIGAAAMGGVVLAKSLKSPKKRLEEVDLKLQALETQFEETQKDYERDKNDLLQRIAMRDRKAEKRLKALNREFEDKKQEYKEEREELLEKRKKLAPKVTKSDKEKIGNMKKRKVNFVMRTKWKSWKWSI